MWTDHMPSLRFCLVLLTCLICLSCIIPVTAQRPEVISYYDIYADVNGAAIYFDSEYKGEISKGSLTVCVVSSRPRPYVRVFAKMDGYETAMVPLPVVAGELQHVPIYLEMIPLTLKIGNLSLSSSPERTKLFIDGKEHGITPQDVTGLVVGTHTIRLTCPGFIAWSENVVVSEGKTSELYAYLIQKDEYGSLSVSSTPEGAEIYLGGRYYGATPMKVNGISAGTHHIEIKMDGYTDDIQTVTVTSNTVTSVSCFLQLIEDEKTAPATLSITSKPAGATVYLDSVIWGATPLTVTDLAPGEYRVELAYAGYSVHQSSVVLSPGETQARDITMKTSPDSELLPVSLFSVIVSLLGAALFVTGRCPGKKE